MTRDELKAVLRHHTCYNCIYYAKAINSCLLHDQGSKLAWIPNIPKERTCEKFLDSMPGGTEYIKFQLACQELKYTVKQELVDPAARAIKKVVSGVMRKSRL